MVVDPDESKICRVKPTSVSESATYVVDVRNFENTEDINKDKFGIWTYSGSHPQVFKVYTEDDGSKSVEVLQRCIREECSVCAPTALHSFI